MEQKASATQASRLRFEREVEPEDVIPGDDVHTLIFDKLVSVTPLSLDMTARVDLSDLESTFKAREEGEK